MPHHFDTKLAREDPSLNVCDLYLFEGTPGTTVMALTVNPDEGLSASDILHSEGLYAFRFDLNGGAREDVGFKFRFGEPRHADADEHVHIQNFQVRRATGQAIGGDKGDILIEGETGKVNNNSEVRVFVGTAPDMFAGDALALHAFLSVSGIFVCVVDVAGTEGLFGPPLLLAKQMRQRLRSVGIAASVTISANVHAALCLARGLSGGVPLQVIPRAEEANARATLAPAYRLRVFPTEELR